MHRQISLVSMVLLQATGSALFADTVTVGVANNGNCIPFGCANGVTRYQQVYDSGQFVAPFDIANISFFDTLNPGSGAVTHATYTISFSTTSASVGGLDIALDNNVGSDTSSFFSGDLAGFSGTKLTIDGTSMFHYNPVLGNLLLDINISGAGTDAGIFLDTEEDSTVMSRAAAGLSDPFNIGLVTEFDSMASPPLSSVPEPRYLVLVLVGIMLAGTGIKALRRKARGTLPGWTDSRSLLGQKPSP